MRTFDDCVVWKGGAYGGYGIFRYRDGGGGVEQRVKVHRVFYLLYNGSIPSGYLVHHECENKLCVNPRHLRLMTPSDHIAHHGTMVKAQRIASGQRAAKTHCKRGHEFTPENTEPNTGGGRRCRTCERLRKRGLLAFRVAGT